MINSKCINASDNVVRIANSTCYQISNVMWITLRAGASIGISMSQWAMLREDSGFKELLDQGSITVDFNA
jgi:hypothetical protein